MSKGNPNHDPKSGEFTSGPGGVDEPTRDAIALHTTLHAGALYGDPVKVPVAGGLVTVVEVPKKGTSARSSGDGYHGRVQVRFLSNASDKGKVISDSKMFSLLKDHYKK
jgi:hypothetical protein